MAKYRVVWGSRGSKRYYRDDEEITQEEYDEALPSKIEELLKSSVMLHSQSRSCWPMKSIGAAVHPDQIPEVMERDKVHGVPTEYTPAGEPVFRDRGHRRNYLKSHGHFDRDGGYGD